MVFDGYKIKHVEEGFIRDWFVQWRLAGVLCGAVVAMWILPWMSPPAWIVWPAVVWTLIGWPAVNWAVDRHATEALLWRIAMVAGHVGAAIGRILANWARDSAQKMRAAPERQRPAPIHGGKSAAHNQFATDPDNSGHWGARSGHWNRNADARIEKPTRPFDWNRFANLPIVRIGLVIVALVAVLMLPSHCSAQRVDRAKSIVAESKQQAAEGSRIVQTHTSQSVSTHRDEAERRERRTREIVNQEHQAIEALPSADTPLPADAVAVWAAGIDRLRFEARCARDPADCGDPGELGGGVPAA